MNSKPVHSQGDWHFSGFVFPTTTPVPDQLFDELLHRLCGAELKVLLYIVRRTFGFKKQSDDISLAQLVSGIKTKKGKVLDRGTGLGKSSVVRALNSLEQKNIILRVRRQSERKGNEATTYTLNINTPLSQNETRVVPKLVQGLSHQRDTQQTARQQTVKQQQQKINKDGGSTSGDGQSIAAVLIEKGVEKNVAQQLVKQHNKQQVENNLDWFEWKQKNHPHSIKTNPAGLLRRAIEQDYATEGHKGFQTRQQKAAASLAKKQRLEVQERLIHARKQQQEASLQQREIERVKLLEMLREQYHTGEQEDKLWAQAMKTLKAQVPGTSFKAYLASSSLLAVREGKVLIAVLNRFVKAQLEDRLAENIQQALGQQLKDQVVTIECLPLAE